MILKLTERIDRMEKTVDIRIGKYGALSLVVLAVVGRYTGSLHMMWPIRSRKQLGCQSIAG